MHSVALPQEVESRIEDIRVQVEALGAELVDLSIRKSRGKSVLTVVADKAGGITLEECAEINRRLSLFFDQVDENGTGDHPALFRGSYLLEVSSPGLDRPLKTEKDFLRAVGQTVRVVQAAQQGAATVTVGEILSVKDSSVDIRKSSDGAVVRLPLRSILKALREIRF